jgi:hypothetical protein
MPTGVLSKLGDKVSWQNAEMLSVLLSKHGGGGKNRPWRQLGTADNVLQVGLPSDHLRQTALRFFLNILLNTARFRLTEPIAGLFYWLKTSERVRWSF